MQVLLQRKTGKKMLGITSSYRGSLYSEMELHKKRMRRIIIQYRTI
jgi:hypothetical protein